MGIAAAAYTGEKQVENAVVREVHPDDIFMKPGDMDKEFCFDCEADTFSLKG